MAAEEEVAAEPAVKVLDDRTGPCRTIYQFGDDHADLKEVAAQSLSQGGLARPAGGRFQVKSLDVEHIAQRGDRKLKLDSQGRQILVQLGREGQQLVALVVQSAAARSEKSRRGRWSGPIAIAG